MGIQNTALMIIEVYYLNMTKISNQQYFFIFGILLLQLFLIIVIGIFIKSIFTEFQINNVKNHRSTILSNEIIYYDEVLTMSAKMAALTGNTLWQERYHDFVPLLEDAIKEAIRTVPEIESELQQTNAANINLINMEEEAFSLVNQGKLEEAIAVLSSDAYEDEKQIYTTAIKHALELLDKGSSENANAFQLRLNELLIMISVLIGLFLVISLVLIKTFIDISKKFRMLSITDELTGLFNRRHFNSVFPSEIKRSKRHNYILAFAMMDIDNFKKYNDIYGHQKGDIVLAEFGEILGKIMHRAGDVVFRLGGEEFGILFATKSEKNAKLLIELIQKAIKDKAIEHIGNKPYNVITVSVGMKLIYPDDKAEKEYEVSTHYHDADQALYQAKTLGRDRTEIWAFT